MRRCFFFLLRVSCSDAFGHDFRHVGASQFILIQHTCKILQKTLSTLEKREFKRKGKKKKKRRFPRPTTKHLRTTATSISSFAIERTWKVKTWICVSKTFDIVCKVSLRHFKTRVMSAASERMETNVAKTYKLLSITKKKKNARTAQLVDDI
ncbi:hypothetical protein BC940DRAFT_142797 [Gongronella butleri]|nr:hypothetical protein BC940DRAFT_142797 [Gongronella butleri]